MNEDLIKALQDFYGHYDPDNKPSEDQLNTLAKTYAGKEGEMWGELYGHYDPDNIPDDKQMEHLTSFANPFKKKASGEGSSTSSLLPDAPTAGEGFSWDDPQAIAQAHPPFVRPARKEKKTEPVYMTYVGRKYGPSMEEIGASIKHNRYAQMAKERPDQEIIEVPSYNGNIVYKYKDEWESEVRENTDKILSLDPQKLLTNPEDARIDYFRATGMDNAARGVEEMREKGYSDDYKEAKQTEEALGMMIRDLDANRIDVEKGISKDLLSSFYEVRSSFLQMYDAAVALGNRGEDVSELTNSEEYQQRFSEYMEFLQDPELNRIDKIYQQKDIIRDAYIDLKERRPEYFKEEEQKVLNQAQVDLFAKEGKYVPMANPHVGRMTASYGEGYNPIAAGIGRVGMETTASIAEAIPVLRNVFLDLTGQDREYDWSDNWIETVNRKFDVSKHLDLVLPSDMQRSIITNTAMVDGYQIDIRDGKPESVRDSQGYAVPKEVSDAIIKKYKDNPRKYEVDRQINTSPILSTMVQGSAQMAVTLLPSGVLSKVGPIAQRAGMVGSSMMTTFAPIYRETLEAFGPENREKAETSALRQTFMIAMADVALGVEGSFVRPGKGNIIRALDKANPIGSSNKMLREFAVSAKEYAKNVISEGLGGGAETLAEQISKQMANDELKMDAFDTTVTVNDFLNNMTEEALGSLLFASGGVNAPRLSKEVLYEAYKDQGILNKLKDPEPYKQVFETFDTVTEGRTLPEQVQIELLSALYTEEQLKAKKVHPTQKERHEADTQQATARVERLARGEMPQRDTSIPSVAKIEQERHRSLNPEVGDTVTTEGGQEFEVMSVDTGEDIGTKMITVRNKAAREGEGIKTMPYAEYAKAVQDRYDAKLRELHPDLTDDELALDRQLVLSGGIPSEEKMARRRQAAEGVAGLPEGGERSLPVTYTSENVSQSGIPQLPNISKALGGKVKFVIHENTASINAAIEERGGTVEGSVDGFYVDDEIHLNKELMESRTALHEGMHPVVDYILAKDPSRFDSLYTELSKMGVKEVEDFASQYTGQQARKEALTEYLAQVADGRIEPEEGVLNKIREWFRSILESLGLVDQVTLETAEDLKQVAKVVSDAMRKGKDLGVDVGGGVQQSMRLFHGSPHSFDNFDTRKINSGEGSQWEGWGLYFTEEENVARWYAKTYGKEPEGRVSIDSKVYKEASDDPQAKERIEEILLDASKGLRDITNPSNEDVRVAVLVAADRAMELYASDQGLLDELYRDELGAPDLSEVRGYIEDFIREVESGEANLTYEKVGGRNLYEVEAHGGKDPSEYDYMQWDGPVTDTQLDKIRKQWDKEFGDVAEFPVNPYISGAAATIAMKDIADIIGDDAYLQFFDMVEVDYESTKMPTVFMARTMKELLNGSIQGPPLLTKKIEENRDKIQAIIDEEVPNPSGAGVYRILAKTLDADVIGKEGGRGAPYKNTSMFLLRAGIDGNKYQSAAEGKFNYVVFDDNEVAVNNRLQFSMRPQENTVSAIDPEVIAAKEVMKAGMERMRQGSTLTRESIIGRLEQNQGGYLSAEHYDAIWASAELEYNEESRRAQIRERARSMPVVGRLYSFASDFHNRYLSSRRGGNQQVADLMAIREGSINSVAEQVVNNVEAVRKLAKRHDVSNETMDAFLRGRLEDPEVIPVELRDRLLDMRQSVDAWTDRLIDQGALQGNAADAATYNKGSYMTRAFRIYEKRNWKPSEAIKATAIEQAMEDPLMRRDYDNQVAALPANVPVPTFRDWVETEVNKTVGNALQRFDGGASIGKDEGILKGRRDLPQVVRDAVAEAGNLTPGTEAALRGYVESQQSNPDLVEQDIANILAGNYDQVPYIDVLPQWVRTAFGEITDPVEAWAVTMYKMSALSWNHWFLDALNASGVGRYIFPDSGAAAMLGVVAGEKEPVKLASAGSSSKSPLTLFGQGGTQRRRTENEKTEAREVYVTKDVYYQLTGDPTYQGYFERVVWNTIKDTLEMGKGTIVGKIEGAVRMNKTVLSPSTQVKNLAGNIPLMLNAGYIGLDELLNPGRTAGRGMAAIRGAGQASGLSSPFRRFGLTGRENPEMDRLIGMLKDNNVLGTSIAIENIRDVVNHSDADSILESLLDPSSATEKAVRFFKRKKILLPGALSVDDMQKMYQFGDDVFKFYAFLKEADWASNYVYQKDYTELNGAERSEVDNIAMKKVKLLLPNYSLIGELGAAFSRAPLVGNFLAFQVEALRVGVNSATLGVGEYLQGKRMGNDALMAVGRRRILGNITQYMMKGLVVGGLNAIWNNAGTALGALLPGFEDEYDEKQKAVRSYVWKWLKNSTLLYQTNQDGYIHVWEASGIDPLNQFSKIYNTIRYHEGTGEDIFGNTDVDQAMYKALLIETFGDFLEPTILRQAVSNYVDGVNQYGEKQADGWDAFKSAIRQVAPNIHYQIYDGIMKATGEEGEFEKWIWGQTGMKHYKIPVASVYGRKLDNYFRQTVSTKKLDHVRKTEITDPMWKVANDDTLAPEEKAAKFQKLENKRKQWLDLLKREYEQGILIGADRKEMRTTVYDKAYGKRAKLDARYIVGDGDYKPLKLEDFK